MRYLHVKQHDQRDCGAACLAMIAAYYGLKMPLGKYRELIKTDSAGSTIYGIVEGAEKIGFMANGLKGTYDELLKEYTDGNITLPLIAHILKEDGEPHFIVIYEIKKTHIKLGDPATDIIKMPIEQFLMVWTGYIITFEVTDRFQKGNLKKGSIDRYIAIIEKQKWILALIIILSLIIAGISMFGTALFEYVVDGLYDVEKGTDIEINSSGIMGLFFDRAPSLSRMCISVILLYIFQIFLQYIRSIISINVSKKIDLPVVFNYYTTLTRLPISFFAGRKIGDLLTRFNDASRVCQMMVDMLFTIIIDGLLVVFYTVFMLSINTTLFLIAFVILSLYTIVIFAFKKPIRNIEMSVMEKNANVSSFLKESIQGMETVKSFGVEKKIREKTFSLVKDYINCSCRSNKIDALQESIVSCISSVGIVILLWVGVILCNKGQLTTGTLISFYAIMGCFLTPMQNLIGLQNDIQSAIVAAERLNDIMELKVEDAEEETQDKTELVVGDIYIDNVIFRYGARNTILEKCTLKIEHNTCVALIGDSGCGKSTLAKLLAGFYEPEEGSIRIGKQNISTISKKELRRKVTYISQETFLFSDTIQSNLFFEGDNVREEINKICGEDIFFKDLPNGLDTMIEENGINLSGGQKQRIAFLRAILCKTEILLLDETTSNMDVITERKIWDIVKQSNKKMTIIIISHRLPSIVNCDKIYLMEKGRVEAEGTHQQLLDECEKYKEMWDAYMDQVSLHG